MRNIRTAVFVAAIATTSASLFVYDDLLVQDFVATNAIAVVLCLLAWCMESAKSQPAKKNNAFVVVVSGMILTGLASFVLGGAVLVNGTMPQKLLAVVSFVLFFSFFGIYATWWRVPEMAKKTHDPASVVTAIMTMEERQAVCVAMKASMDLAWPTRPAAIKIQQTALTAFKAMKAEAVYA